MPQPTVQPQIVNAGSSEDGRNMTARHCDWSFPSTPSLEATPDVVRDIKSRASALNRSVRTATFPYILWRDTEEEARAEITRMIECKDRVAAQNWMDEFDIGGESFDQFTLDMFTVGAGAIHVVGTKEQVADKLAFLYDGGLDGVLIIMQDYLGDTQRFARDIIPLLRERGVVA